MIPPALAFQRFGIACLLGVGLGVLYGFLRPLRPRHTGLSDALFLLGAAWVWLYLALGVCGGDLRFGYCLGLPIGGVAWETTAGRLLRPVFALLWRLAGRIAGLAVWPLKKLLRPSICKSLYVNEV